MSQFNFIRQEIFEEGPKESVGLGATPIVQYQEGITELPQPISPQQATDYGINWNALGAYASETAADLYKQTVDYVISSKAKSITGVQLDEKDKLNDWATNAKATMRQYEQMGVITPPDVHAGIMAEYNKIKNGYKEKAIEILGQSDYDLFTDPKRDPLMTDLGSKYQDLALTTRAGLIDIENAYNSALFDLDAARISTAQSLAVKEKGKKAPLDPNELENQVALPSQAGLPVGNLSDKTNPFVKNPRTLTIQNEDGSTQEIPVVVPDPDGNIRLNEGVGPDQLSPEEIEYLAAYDVTHGTIQNFNNIHPEVKKLLKSFLSNDLSPTAAYYTARLLGNLNPSTIRTLASKEGFSEPQAALLAIYHSASRNPGFNYEGYTSLSKATPEDIQEAYNLFNGIRVNLTDSTNKPNVSFTTGSQQEVAQAVVVWNALVKNFLPAGSDTDYVIENKKIGLRTEGKANKNIETLLDNNPEAKLLLIRSLLFVKSQDNLAGLDLTVPENVDTISNALKNSFLPVELGAAQYVWIPETQKLHWMPNASRVNETIKQAVALNENYANIPEDQRESVKTRVSKDPNKTLGVAFSGNTISGVVTKEDASAFIRRVTPRADASIVDLAIRHLHETTTKENRNQQRTAKSTPSDSVLMQMAFAANPRIYSALGLMSSDEDYNSLGMDKKVELFAQAMKSLPDAKYWDYRPDYSNPNALSSERGGIPLVITNIPVYDRAGKKLNLLDMVYSSNQLTGGGLTLRTGTDQRELLVLSDSATEAIEKNMGEFLENSYSGNTKNPNLALRDAVGFPAKDNTFSILEDKRFIADTDWKRSTADRRAAFQVYWDTHTKFQNKNITSVSDFIEQYRYNEEAIKELIVLDPTVYNENPTNSMLHTFLKDYGAKQGAFTPAVLETMVGVGKEIGLTTFSDYLSLMFSFTEQYEANPEYFYGYPLSKTRGLSEDYPSLVQEGKYKGLLPYNLESTAATELAEQGYSIYREIHSGDLYAFHVDEDKDPERFDLVWYNEQAPRGVIRMRGVDLEPHYAIGDISVLNPEENLDNLLDLVEEYKTDKKHGSILMQYFGEEPKGINLASYRKLVNQPTDRTTGEKFKEILDVPEKLIKGLYKELFQTKHSVDSKAFEGLPSRGESAYAAGKALRQLLGLDEVNLELDQTILPKLDEKLRKQLLSIRELAPDGKVLLDKRVTRILQEKKEPAPGAVSDKPYITLINEYEGLKTTAYWDPNGKVWTIGKGTTKYPDGSPVKQGDTITEEQATQFVQTYIDTKVIPTLSKTIPTWTEMSPNQQAAIISFAYNVGENFYNKQGFETISKALSKVSTFNKVPQALSLYNKSNGKKLGGLVKRRKAEADLWSSSK